MSVRSRYSATGYQHFRATSAARTARRVDNALHGAGLSDTVTNREQMCPACAAFCQQCEYRQLGEHLEEMMNNKGAVKAGLELKPEPVVAQPEEKKGLIGKFFAYVAKNQENLKKSGDTTLMEDLSDMGKKMFNNAGNLGEEELAKIHGRNQKRPQPRYDDDDTIDFLIGKGRYK